MTEPSVDFELSGIKDPESRGMFDQIRRWFDFREDVKSPSMQTFTGQLDDGESIRLHVPGVIYGAIGMTLITNGHWIPMQYGAPSNECGFVFSTDNTKGNFVVVECEGSSLRNSLPYRVTVFYRDE